MNFISCAPKIKSTPVTALKLGYIVHADKNEVQALTINSGVTVRTINEKANIYEIRGMDKNAIINKIGHSEDFEIQKNIMIETPIKANAQSDFAVIPTEIPGFKHNCINDPFIGDDPPKLAPKAMLDIVTKDGDIFRRDALARLVTDLNQEVKFTSTSSRNESVGGKLSYSWLVTPPEYSNYNIHAVATGKDFSFKVDALGKYAVTLVAQGKNRLCDAYTITFGVTANPPYKQQVAATVVDKNYHRQFNHLAILDAETAWTNSQGDGIKVAVIDTGVNYQHPYLSSNIAINEKEIPNNGIDDDKNGFTDDVIGWDFINNDSTPFDDNGHGTHVAGLIAANTFGVAPKAKILPIKVFNAEGSCELGNIIMGFLYAIDQGANVINFSGGHNFYRWKMLSGVLQYAKMKNVTIISAAGNNRLDVDQNPYYPANLGLDNIISVAASNSLSELSSYSNFGKNSVDFLAPGGDDKLGELILSTALWNPQNVLLTAMAGTSMSTPLVTGTVASLLSLEPLLTANPTELKNILVTTMTPNDSLVNKVKNAGVINAGRATNLVKQKKIIK